MSQDLPSSKYDRQKRLSLWDQQIIEDSQILIAGVGGTGSEVAKNLALLGTGKLILVDADTIEFSNLNRQMLFREEDVGEKKSEIARMRIQEQYNPDIKIESFPDILQRIPQRAFREVDIIAGCVDNFLARQFINAMAVELNKPLIDSATDGFFGQVQYINPRKTACLACDNPAPPDETRILTAPCTLVGAPRQREHCAWKALYDFNTSYDREPLETSQEDLSILTNFANKYAKKYNYSNFDEKELLQLILFRVPSLITVNAVTSGIQSQEILKALFLEKRTSFKKNEMKRLDFLIDTHRFRIPSLFIYSALTGSINTFEMVPDPNCLVCGQPTIDSQTFFEVEVDPSSKFKTLFEKTQPKKSKDTVGFLGNKLLPEDGIIADFLSDGDRITLSSLVGDEEIRLQIKFQK
ncbi:MAG: ThiF family adenylyltransferase [Candidatus Heimdallarchaeota archaeon]|nr:MAG: ThiF family adenylyltransferase [Candidatus Heimdallarchaeota archaeon]